MIIFRIFLLRYVEGEIVKNSRSISTETLGST